MDLSAEDTPLSLRRSSGDAPGKKRLRLVDIDIVDECPPVEEDESPSGLEDGNKSGEEKDKQIEDEEESAEKTDDVHPEGIRRSTRPKKQLYGTFNESWIFSGKTAKVCFSFKTRFAFLLLFVALK